MVKNNPSTEALIAAISGRWTMNIILQLGSQGTLRFSQIKDNITGVSSRMLTERLRGLEAGVFLTREQLPTVPPHVNYTLTDRGQELYNVIKNFDGLAKKWDFGS